MSKQWALRTHCFFEKNNYNNTIIDWFNEKNSK